LAAGAQQGPGGPGAPGRPPERRGGDAGAPGRAKSGPSARATAGSGHTLPCFAPLALTRRAGCKRRTILRRIQRARFQADRRTGGGATCFAARSRRGTGRIRTTKKLFLQKIFLVFFSLKEIVFFKKKTMSIVHHIWQKKKKTPKKMPLQVTVSVRRTTIPKKAEFISGTKKEKWQTN
jgi:hypothetical protein